MTGSQANEQFLVFIALDRPVALDPAAIAESLRRKAVDNAATAEVLGDSAPGHPLMIMVNRIPLSAARPPALKRPPAIYDREVLQMVDAIARFSPASGGEIIRTAEAAAAMDLSRLITAAEVSVHR